MIKYHKDNKCPICNSDLEIDAIPQHNIVVFCKHNCYALTTIYYYNRIEYVVDMFGMEFCFDDLDEQGFIDHQNSRIERYMNHLRENDRYVMKILEAE